MKTLIKTLSVFAVLISFTSCQNEQEKKSQELADNYVKFVDSVANINQEEAIANWDAIQEKYETKTNELNIEVDKLEDKTDLNEKINAATLKYEECQKKLMETKAKSEAESKRKLLFGDDYIGDDMKFTWVNKDNILKVYDQFTSTVTKNKETYSREDWDEIKLLYEALDTRKNTVENEGLSDSDNMKIASIKFKFGPMLTVNRMGSKAEENSESKE